MNLYFAGSLINIFILILLLLPISNTQSAFRATFAEHQPAKLEWYADLYPHDNDYVRVQIDTTGLPVNTVIHVNSIEISCNSGKRSENHTFTPADFGNQFSELIAGKVYEGYFRHSCAQAKSITSRSIVGKGISFDKRPIGVKGRPRSGSRKVFSWSKRASKKPLNVTNADIIVLGEVPIPKPSP